MDFSGYIDKFYSRSIFHYDLSGEMIKSVNKLFHTVVLDDGNKKMSLGEVRKAVAGAIIKQILHSFIQHDLISIRVLKRIFSGTQSLKERYVWREGKYDAISNNDIELIKAIDFLIFLFQDYKLFVDKCKVLVNRDIEILDSVSNHFFINQIVKAGSVKNYWSNNKERPKEVGQELQFEIQIDSFNLRYTISTEYDSYSLKERYIYRVYSISDSIGKEIKIDDINFFLLLVGLLEKTDFKSLLNLKYESV